MINYLFFSSSLVRILSLAIVFLILFATGMHIHSGHKHDLKMEETPTVTPSEPILSRTAHQIDEYEQSISSDEATPLLSQSRGEQVDSGIFFSLMTLHQVRIFLCQLH